MSTKWALTNFDDWRKCRNHRFADESEKQVPEDILKCSDPGTLCKWLTLYVAETRKKDGNEYPPKTIYQLLTGLLRHMRTLNPSCPNFLDTDNRAFASLHTAIDNVFRGLRSSGVGSSSKSAEMFSKEEENKLWDSRVLGTESPKSLLRAVFFLNGKKIFV